MKFLRVIQVLNGILIKDRGIMAIIDSCNKTRFNDFGDEIIYNEEKIFRNIGGFSFPKIKSESEFQMDSLVTIRGFGKQKFIREKYRSLNEALIKKYTAVFDVELSYIGISFFVYEKKRIFEFPLAKEIMEEMIEISKNSICHLEATADDSEVYIARELLQRLVEHFFDEHDKNIEEHSTLPYDTLIFNRDIICIETQNSKSLYLNKYLSSSLEPDISIHEFEVF